MHRIAFFLSPGFQMLDLAGPLCAFQSAMLTTEAKAYDLRTLSVEGGLVASNSGVGTTTQPAGIDAADTLIMVGGDIAPMLDAQQTNAFRVAASGARRVASVCTGAFMLAELGLLNGRTATTHWQQVARLQRDYPRVRVEGDRIFVADGWAWTSAGISAGIDLALAIIEADLGLAASQSVARDLVVYHRRSGGQSQFSALSDLDGETDRIRATLRFVREHIAEPLPAERLAEAACLSLRHFGRAFKRETGETPAKAVERIRVEVACLRIEQGMEPIEVIARSVGFSDSERMRRAFVRLFGIPPQGFRRATRHNRVV
ncbi:helix-turn-helix domain-containing protein [Lichenihabitans sp. Uapishka_5]|uniref:GlxA family transcriptional regulator n=1 Tax=Lichenihabitans sp. Uapishka_5 TaxID=3037302 RepID=UPI0029E7DEE0|nr:helix-turn-helix domain-containing protein [Lichenihabitans sp. Uapishka_5]MDX7953878.1 helix-turn-helix domain-containing protein [Lichenihabitans sp. Uapishka_5]